MKKISVFNIRVGLACNSSSSHSILILNDKEKSYTDEEHSFEWNFFTAGSKQSKENYLLACLHYAIRQIIPENQQKKFLEKFFDKDNVENLAQYSVDHQSQLTFPLTLDGKLNEEFIYDFKKFLERDDVVIVGGNDNTEDEHHLISEKAGVIFDKEYPKEDFVGDWVARKDKNHDFWTLFNKRTGSKLRFSFSENEKSIKKASSPELVDVKITDFCPYACEFCYQDSTLNGKHASLDFIKKLAKELAKAEVLECCLGGGETTLHPNFVEILKTFHENGIVVNFTTKNMNLLKSSLAKEIIQYTGAIAFSVESVEDVEKVYSSYLEFEDKTKIKRSYSSVPLINIQYVMGSTPLSEFINIVKESAVSNFSITLLGFKENGRGQNFEMHDYSNWLEELKRLNYQLIKDNIYSSISVDTALAAQYKQELQDAGIDERTYHTNEGGFSLYIDAVNQTMAPSSYVGFEQEKPFTENWLEDYKDIFIEAPNKKPRKKIAIK